MKKRLPIDSQSIDIPSPEMVVANWIKTVSCFHGYYIRITELVHSNDPDQPVLKAAIGVGQCPASELRSLLTRMHKELERLMLDTDGFSKRVDPQNFQKLATHSYILNEYNEDAQKLLALASLSAS